MHARPSPRRSPRQEYAGRSTSTPSSTDDGAGDANRLFCQRKSRLSSPSNDVGGTVKSPAPDKFIVKENNAKDQHNRLGKVCVGKHVNDLHSNVTTGDVGKSKNLTNKVLSPGVKSETSLSSESESPSTETQLNMLLGSNIKLRGTQKPLGQQCHVGKQRLSSGHSVASVEMDGDNLMVVTENTSDSAFDENNELTSDVSSKATTDMTIVESDSPGASSDSTYPSPTGEHYNRMLQELVTASAATHNEGPTLPHPSTPAIDRSSMERLKDSLDLKLLSINIVDKALPSGSHSPGCESSSSGSTSGPDSCPPSPITPPLYQSVMESGDASENSAQMTCVQNMSFPSNSVTYGDSAEGVVYKTAREQVCGVFSVDLGQSLYQVLFDVITYQCLMLLHINV